MPLAAISAATAFMRLNCIQMTCTHGEGKTTKKPTHTWRNEGKKHQQTHRSKTMMIKQSVNTNDSKQPNEKQHACVRRATKMRQREQQTSVPPCGDGDTQYNHRARPDTQSAPSRRPHTVSIRQQQETMKAQKWLEGSAKERKEYETENASKKTEEGTIAPRARAGAPHAPGCSQSKANSTCQRCLASRCHQTPWLLDAQRVNVGPTCEDKEGEKKGWWLHRAARQGGGARMRTTWTARGGGQPNRVLWRVFMVPTKYPEEYAVFCVINES